jgi:Cu2+-exporting ATPase
VTDPPTAADSATGQSLLLEVEGMKCGGCVRAVEQRLTQQDGVRQASVNLLTRTAWIGLDPGFLEGPAVDPATPLITALAGLGFAARRREQESLPLSAAERQELIASVAAAQRELALLSENDVWLRVSTG